MGERRGVPLSWLATSETGKRDGEQRSPDNEDLPLYLKVHRGIPLTATEIKELEQTRKLIRAVRVRSRYKWPWGAGAEYLYRELIRALGLEKDEEELLRLAKPKPGRKEERELATRIWQLRAEGKTALETTAILANEGIVRSVEAIESYRKSRRKNKPRY